MTAQPGRRLPERRDGGCTQVAICHPAALQTSGLNRVHPLVRTPHTPPSSSPGRPAGPGSVLQSLIASQLVPVVDLREIFRQAAQSAIITSALAGKDGVMGRALPPAG